ncbi:MAG: hypothetical protein KDB37_10435 [Ilumatobacter sp.]|nr:hypothetical protein [Ilumatobacter sp.]
MTRTDRKSGTAAGRATVVPGALTPEGDANSSNVSADSRSTVVLHLIVDDGSSSSGSQRVTARVPNWLQVVYLYAGTTRGPWQQLPTDVTVPVWIDATGRVVDVDVDRSADELAAHRTVARSYWLDTDAPLSSVRHLARLPGDVSTGIRRGRAMLRDAVRSVRRGVAGGASDVAAAPAWTDEEAEAARRNAVTLRARLEQRPGERERLRATALEAGPSNAEQVRAGLRHPVDFEHWLMVQEVSGVLTVEEVGRLRAEADPLHRDE